MALSCSRGEDTLSVLEILSCLKGDNCGTQFWSDYTLAVCSNNSIFIYFVPGSHMVSTLMNIPCHGYCLHNKWQARKVASVITSRPSLSAVTRRDDAASVDDWCT